MAEDFYNQNLHPVTMFKALASQNSVNKYSVIKKTNYINSKQLDGLVSSIQLKEDLGIGTKKIKALYALLGEEPKFNQMQTYYKESLIPQIKELIIKDKVELDISGYISNKELMNMFSFSAYKAWEIAKKEKLIKIKFSGNVNHYQREKAIEAFGRHKV